MTHTHGFRFLSAIILLHLVSAISRTYVDVTQDLGTNNPSVQTIDNTNYYNFARGDGGWISAFEVAEAMKLKRIYFPAGIYFFGGSSNTSCSLTDIEPRNGLCYAPVIIDASLYPSLAQGVEVFGDGGGATQFRSWAPVMSGSAALTFSASTTLGTAYWSVHDLQFMFCTVGFGVAFNNPTAAYPRNEFNTLHLARVSVWNGLVNNTCNGGSWDRRPGAQRANSMGGLYLGHIWSSTLSVDEVAVQSGGPDSEANSTGAVVLNEVQYSTLDLRGLGAARPGAFARPDPRNESLYYGWGVIFEANVYACTITQLHVEIAGGGALIKASTAENIFTSSIFSMMAVACIVQLDGNADTQPQYIGNNVFEAVAINLYPVNGSLFSGLIAGNRSTLIVRSSYTFPFTRLANDFNLGPAPLASTDPCVRGERRVTREFLYDCVADNTWRRIPYQDF